MNEEANKGLPQRTSSKSSRMAYPLHVKALEKHLDLNPFIDQLEKMFSKPLEISMENSSQTKEGTSANLDLNVKDLWPDEATRKKDLSEFYNFKTVGKRKWLKNLLLECSDSESDEQITDSDIKVLLKIHKYRRKYQKRYHTDIMNSQYTYYAAGLLSEYDFHPEHQAYILEQYGFMMPEVTAPPATTTVATPPAVCTKKPETCKKRKSIACVSALPQTTAPSAQKRRESTKSASLSSSEHSVSTVSVASGFPNDVTVIPLSFDSPPILPHPPAKKCKTTKSPCTSAAAANFGASSASCLTAPAESAGFYTATTASYFCDDTVKNQHNYQQKPCSSSSISKPEPPKQEEQESPPVGPDAHFRAVWKTIVNDVLPKAYNEKYIARMYRNIVLRDKAQSCALFLQQAKAGILPGKAKNRHRKHKNEPIGLRPVPPAPKPPTTYPGL